MKELQHIDDDLIYDIIIGKNAQENWNIIDNAKSDDWWFHIDDFPSCHVILKTIENIKPSKKIINYCACLCKENSKLKNNKNVKIIYTQIKNIKKADIVGSVYTKNTKIIKC